MTRVVVGLSGGVDSSVAAYLLKEQGYDVIGLFMKNWHDDSVTESGECPWVDDSNDALMVAQKLGIPFQTIDLSAEYKERIVNYMFAEYEKGRTPNPDVLCNREIKFDTFLQTALKLNADHVATGHYCRKDVVEKDGRPIYRLLAGLDPEKEQSYFLCQLNQEQLARALFPIGNLHKHEVRQIAGQQGLVTAHKKDSQGLCFVGKVHLPDFLAQQLAPKQGEIVEVPADAPVYQNGTEHADDLTQAALDAVVEPYYHSKAHGEVVGEHKGAHFFTIGQRKGIGVGGRSEPLFVIQRDVQHNILYTGMGHSHPGLYRRGLFVRNEEVHWVRPDLALAVGGSQRYDLRIRYRQPLQAGTLYRQPNGLYVIFDEPQRGVAPGQFVAWYSGDELVGSGVIG